MHGASAKQVEMEVVNRLTAVAAGVDDDAVATRKLTLPNRAGCIQKLPKQFRGRRFDIDEVLPRNNEEMRRGHGIGIREGHACLVLVNNLDGDRASGDLAEDAVCHGEILVDQTQLAIPQEGKNKEFLSSFRF